MLGIGLSTELIVTISIAGSLTGEHEEVYQERISVAEPWSRTRCSLPRNSEGRIVRVQVALPEDYHGPENCIHLGRIYVLGHPLPILQSTALFARTVPNLVGADTDTGSLPAVKIKARLVHDASASKITLVFPVNKTVPLREMCCRRTILMFPPSE